LGGVHPLGAPLPEDRQPVLRREDQLIEGLVRHQCRPLPLRRALPPFSAAWSAGASSRPAAHSRARAISARLILTGGGSACASGGRGGALAAVGSGSGVLLAGTASPAAGGCPSPGAGGAVSTTGSGASASLGVATTATGTNSTSPSG